MMKAKKYFFLCLSIAVLMLASIAGFNYWQDPANLFLTEEQYHPYTKALAEGHTLVVKGNYDERLYKKSEIMSNPHPRDVIILGSSRAMPFGQENLGELLDVENLCVSGAVLQDDVLMWHLYQKYNGNGAVKNVIIEVAPWLFNKGYNDARYKVLAKDYSEAVRKYGKTEEKISDNGKKEQLLSIKYTQASFEQWKKSGYKSNPIPIAIYDEKDELQDNWGLRYPDGSVEFSKLINDRDVETITLENVKKGKISKVEHFKEIDRELQELFILLVEDIQSQGAKVILYFPPYHPHIYAFLKENKRYDCVFESESWFRSYAKAHDLGVLGSYDPSVMGLEGNDFCDSIHLKRRCFLSFTQGALK